MSDSTKKKLPGATKLQQLGHPSVNVGFGKYVHSSAGGFAAECASNYYEMACKMTGRALTNNANRPLRLIAR